MPVEIVCSCGVALFQEAKVWTGHQYVVGGRAVRRVWADELLR